MLIYSIFFSPEDEKRTERFNAKLLHLWFTCNKEVVNISSLSVWVLPQDSVTLYGRPSFFMQRWLNWVSVKISWLWKSVHTAYVGFEGQTDISFICRHCEGNSRLQAADIMNFLVFPSRDTHPLIFLLLFRREKKISFFGNGVKVKR